MNATCTFRLPGDPWNPAKILDNCRLGRLTTEHAASSYGLPVVVGEDGSAYGTGDVEDGTITLARDAQDGMADEEFDAAVQQAQAAGFRVIGY